MERLAASIECSLWQPLPTNTMADELYGERPIPITSLSTGKSTQDTGFLGGRLILERLSLAAYGYGPSADAFSYQYQRTISQQHATSRTRCFVSREWRRDGMRIDNDS